MSAPPNLLACVTSTCNHLVATVATMAPIPCGGRMSMSSCPELSQTLELRHYSSGKSFFSSGEMGLRCFKLHHQLFEVCPTPWKYALTDTCVYLDCGLLDGDSKSTSATSSMDPFSFELWPLTIEKNHTELLAYSCFQLFRESPKIKSCIMEIASKDPRIVLSLTNGLFEDQKNVCKREDNIKEEKSTKMKELIFSLSDSNYVKFLQAILCKHGLKVYEVTEKKHFLLKFIPPKA
ncbi:hypothetical protein EDC04DRAFT_2599889 [Pisolithus marmoratus]|nr:hypothetical protein EDC04DRAFT_2599889 [Pisolithus marmoratus]